MSSPKSVRLTEKSEAALAFLKERLGGFNLQQAINKTIIAAAKEQGWRGLIEDEET